MGLVLWLRAALFTLALPGTVLVWVPLWITASDGEPWDVGTVRWLGLVPLSVGAAGLLWCIWDFGHRGEGTLAPVDPPKFVVRSGLYRVVRNPMYVAVLVALAGEVLLSGSTGLAVWAVAVTVGFNVFVLAYEEPALRRRFGSDYEAYCRGVPRWIPRRPRR